MRRLTLCVLLCLMSLSSSALLADARSSQQLSELVSRSRLMCASALLYFDPQLRSPDPRGLTAVYYHLNTLETLVLQLGQPAELQAPLLALKASFARLEKMPRSERRQYPQLLAEMLGQQRLLLAAAAERQVEVEAQVSQGTLLLQRQSRDLAQLLLDYQLRHYPWPQARGDLLAIEQRQQIDQAIQQRFVVLEQELPGQGKALQAARRHYQFVRSQLQSGAGTASGGAEFYLSRAVLDLDELAAGTPESN